MEPPPFTLAPELTRPGAARPTPATAQQEMDLLEAESKHCWRVGSLDDIRWPGDLGPLPSAFHRGDARSAS
eukprot:5356007-Pyramimonas_sp.AAC.1